MVDVFVQDHFLLPLPVYWHCQSLHPFFLLSSLVLEMMHGINCELDQANGDEETKEANIDELVGVESGEYSVHGVEESETRKQDEKQTNVPLWTSF
jgi:hypothetical protein